MKAGVDYIGLTVSFYCHDGNGNFVMHKRSQNCRDERGNWDLGGGQVEFGEELEEALVRELREEYGCEGIIEQQLPPFTMFRETDGVPTHWVSVGYIIRVDPAQVRIGEPASMDELKWFRLDALPENIHSTVPKRLSIPAQRVFFKRFLEQK